MCTAPLLHKRLKLGHRTELALAGFVLLDVFRMLSEERCDAMQLPKGSCFIASQTTQTLQSCALACVVIALSKPQCWNPWERGVARLSELPIEQAFGNLRAQSRNSQLSSRGFFQADARLALKAPKVINQERDLVDSAVPEKFAEKPLTDEEFLGLICRLNPLECVYICIYLHTFANINHHQPSIQSYPTGSIPFHPSPIPIYPYSSKSTQMNPNEPK